MSSVRWDVAVTSDGTRVWIDDYSGEDVYCPECNGEMIAVRGEIVQHHYRHSADSNCSGESALHWSKKYQIADSLRNIGTVEVEGVIGGYRADILFEGKWAFEVVYSNPPSAEKMESLRDNLVVFNFSDDRTWGDMDVLFKGRVLEQIVEDLGNSIVKGEDVDVCNICREVKGISSRLKEDGRCVACDIAIIPSRDRGRGNRGPGMNRHSLFLPNITEGRKIAWEEKNLEFVPVNQRRHEEDYTSMQKREWNFFSTDPEIRWRIDFDKGRRKDMSSSETQEDQIVKQFDELVGAAKKHNEWALSTSGNEKYHLSNLRLEPYEGDGSYADPCIDAVCRHMSTVLGTDSFGRNLGEVIVRGWLKRNESIIPAYHRLWKKQYDTPSENPLIPMLVELELGSVPLLLRDTTGIEEGSSQTALSDSFWKLIYAVSAGKLISDRSKHPSLVSLMEELEEPLS